jgi:predicted RNA-binding Zn-ribbon protein involved in translation (DUF1610 family)
MALDKRKAIPSQLFASAGIGAAGGFLYALCWEIVEVCMTAGGNAELTTSWVFLSLILLPSVLGYIAGWVVIAVTGKAVWGAKAFLSTPALYTVLGAAGYSVMISGFLSGIIAYVGSIIIALSCLFAVLGSLHAVRRFERLRRRLVPRLCTRCGYNLTGNVSGRCPECGARISRHVRSEAWPSAQSEQNK